MRSSNCRQFAPSNLMIRGVGTQQNTKGSTMKDRWQKSLQEAVAAYDTPMPWERGTQRQELIARRKRETKVVIKRHVMQSASS